MLERVARPFSTNVVLCDERTEHAVAIRAHIFRLCVTVNQRHQCGLDERPTLDVFCGPAQLCP